MHFYRSNVVDAIASLDALQPATGERSQEQADLLDRLRARLEKLADEEARRTRVMGEHSGPETLLHGDLWPENVFVITGDSGIEVRLIDWDHAAVGPIHYDLSTFLNRFPSEHRREILKTYLACIDIEGWRVPGLDDWNVLFETAELARIANRIIWPAIAIGDGESWGYDELKEIERWFEVLQPTLPLTSQPAETDGRGGA